MEILASEFFLSPNPKLFILIQIFMAERAILISLWENVG